MSFGGNVVIHSDTPEGVLTVPPTRCFTITFDADPSGAIDCCKYRILSEKYALESLSRTDPRQRSGLVAVQNAGDGDVFLLACGLPLVVIHRALVHGSNQFRVGTCGEVLTGDAAGLKQFCRELVSN